MSFARSLRCRRCGREYPLEPLNLCDFCFSPVEVTYDYKAIAKGISRKMTTAGPSSTWRYYDLLPVSGKVVDIGTGFTPLTKAENLGEDLGLKRLSIMNDCLNPARSFQGPGGGGSLGQRFGVIPNIRRADITEDRGWGVLELEGDEEAIERGIA